MIREWTPSDGARDTYGGIWFCKLGVGDYPDSRVNTDLGSDGDVTPACTFMIRLGVIMKEFSFAVAGNNFGLVTKFNVVVE